MKKFILSLALFLTICSVTRAEKNNFNDETSPKTNEIIKLCSEQYPQDVTNDNFSKITIAQRNINSCIKTHIFSTAKHIFSQEQYEKFVKQMTLVENSANDIFTIIFLGDMNNTSDEWTESWVIEQRKTEILTIILTDIIYAEKWAD